MQDAIIAGTGNSRVLKTAPGALERYPTHEALMQAFEDGSFLFDFLRNPSGYTQLGTDLKKETMLQDATAALVGLGAAATPNDMFSALAQTLNGKIENGSYVGTVTPVVALTPASTREIYCTGIPRALFLAGDNTWQKGANYTYDYPVLLISIGVPGMTLGTIMYPSNGSNVDSDRGDATKYATFSYGKISLYHVHSYFNRAGTTYYYTILK